jgi:hypothetical protein
MFRSVCHAIAAGIANIDKQTATSELVGAVLATARKILKWLWSLIGEKDRFADQDSTGRHKDAPYGSGRRGDVRSVCRAIAAGVANIDHQPRPRDG